MLIGTPEVGAAGQIVVAVRGAAEPATSTTGLAGVSSAEALDSALSAAGLADLILSVVNRDPRSEAASGQEGPSTSPAPRTATVLVCLGAVVFAAPALLSRLVARLEEEGFGVGVVATIPTRDRDLGWAPAALVARHHFPPTGIDDALADLGTSSFAEESLHHGRPVARAWLEADLRIVLAPFATDAAEGFVGVLSALGGVAPEVPGADSAEAVADLLAQAPPHLAVLDATVVSHGSVGTAVRRELRAGTVVASRSALLVDVAAAAMLGVDPGISPTVAACLSEVGLPARNRVDGHLGQLPGIRAPSVPLVRSLHSSRGADGLARVLAAATAVDAGTPPRSSMAGEHRTFASPGNSADAGAAHPDSPVVVIASEPEADPDPVLAALRAAIGPWVVAAADSPAAASALAGMQGAAALAANTVTAWRTTFAKDSLTRVTAPLGLDLSAYRAADYEAVEELLRPLVDLVAAIPNTGDPLKWQHVDGSILFEVTRTVNADYGSWVERVDVSHAIRLMADYLGGRCVVVSRDRSERPVRQAERNLYLPQPNYLAFSGGQVIDVCKLEVVRYHRDSREIWWRTVRSPNGSAVYDDGTVEFADVGAGRTRVTIRGRQRFTLPLFWQVMDIDRTPGLREVLTTDAYRRFFTATLDNFEACYEGRPFEIGRKPVDRGLPTRDLGFLLGTARQAASEWLARASEDPRTQGTGGQTVETGPPGLGSAGLIAEAARQWAGTAGGVTARPVPREPDYVDVDGFRHFGGKGQD